MFFKVGFFFPFECRISKKKKNERSPAFPFPSLARPFSLFFGAYSSFSSKWWGRGETHSKPPKLEIHFFFFSSSEKKTPPCSPTQARGKKKKKEKTFSSASISVALLLLLLIFPLPGSRLVGLQIRS